jgi:hypothetical protein
MNTKPKSNTKGTKTRRVVKKEKIPFDDLPVLEQRVAIARDVLAQLKAKKIQPMRGTYLEMELTELVENDAQVHTLLSLASECRVCALGSLFVSAVKFHDQVAVGYYRSTWEPKRSFSVGDRVYEYLMKFFKKQQLCAMEREFESNDDGEASTVLIEIMKNIIRNKGLYITQAGMVYGEEEKIKW